MVQKSLELKSCLSILILSIAQSVSNTQAIVSRFAVTNAMQWLLFEQTFLSKMVVGAKESCSLFISSSNPNNSVRDMKV